MSDTATVYAVFRFVKGNSMYSKEGPLTFICVLPHEDKYEVLERDTELAGLARAYGLKISERAEMNTWLHLEMVRLHCLEAAWKISCGNADAWDEKG